jgi:hypothetical protein
VPPSALFYKTFTAVINKLECLSLPVASDLV